MEANEITNAVGQIAIAQSGITNRAAMQRINRALAKQGEQLRKYRGGPVVVRFG